MESADHTRLHGLGRLMPIVDWLPRYDRSMLRGDVLAGIAVTAMIVPKDLGYAGIAGVPVQNGLYAAAAGAIVYALFCTSRHISTGPSSSLAAVAGGAVLFTGVGGAQAAELVAAITLVTGALFLLLAALSPRLDRAVPLPGGRHGLPRRRRGRRRDRRAAEADRNVDVRGHRLGRARVVDPVARRRELDDRARGSGGAGGHLRPALPRPPRAGSARARRRRAPRDVALRPRRARCRARRAGAARAAGAGAPGPRRLPAALLDHPRGGDRVAPDRLLADRRRRARVRGPAPLPHRRQPGVGRAGDGQRGLGGVPGDAGLDEPVGELAQRVGRREHARSRRS